MVAAYTPAPPTPPAPALAPPVHPGPGKDPSGRAANASTLAEGEKYDLEKIASDRTTIISRTVDFWENVLIPIDQLVRMKPDLSKPYLKVGDVVPTQYTHSLMADFINKGIPYLLSKGVSYNFTPDNNPRASVENLEIAGKIVRKTFEHNAKGGRNTIGRRANLIGIRGGYAAHYEIPAADDADRVNDGFPIVSYLCDLVDVQWDRDPHQHLKRVIFATRRLVGEIPPHNRGTHDDMNEVVDYYEHWDRINYGCVINGSEVVGTLRPHGYVNRLGQPMLPWVIGLHNEGDFTLGDSDITSMSLTQLRTLVGHPPAEALLESTKHLSFILTLLRFCIVNGVLPEKVIRGKYLYDRDRRTYLMEESNPHDGVEIIDTAKNLPAILSVAQFFQALGEQSGMGLAMLSGMKQEISGTSAHEQTDFGRAPLDAVRDTLESTLAEEAEMIIAMVASNTNPSIAQRYKAKYNAPLPAKDPTTAEEYTKGRFLGMSEEITGEQGAQITWLNLEGVYEPSVSVQTPDDLPLEQSYQIGMTLLQSDKSPFDPAEVIEKYFHYDNAQAAIARGNLAKLYANPQLPFADLAALKQLCVEKVGEIDPQTLALLRAQIAEAEKQALVNTVHQKLAAIQQGMLPPSSNPQTTAAGPPPPNGAPPPNAPMPPGAPPPTPIAGASPGAPPPIPFPQRPPPPGLYG